jgi:hypothetical protein
MQPICVFLMLLVVSVRAAEFLREGTVSKGKDAPGKGGKGGKSGKGMDNVPYSVVQVGDAMIPVPHP